MPTVSIYVSNGQPNSHGKIPMGSPWAANSTAHWAAHFFIFRRSGLPTELRTVSLWGSIGQPNLQGKIPMGSPWVAHSTAHWAANFFHIFDAVVCLMSCPLSCPLFPYMEVVDSLICMAKFQWTAHGQPTLLPTSSPWAAKWAAPLFFFCMGV